MGAADLQRGTHDHFALRRHPCPSGQAGSRSSVGRADGADPPIDAGLHLVHKYYTADDGEVVAIIRFETRDQLEAWVHEGRHGKLQAVANVYYESFWVQSAEVYKEYYWQDGVKTMDEMTSFFREADHLAESGRSY
jgi:hypothetical protein